MRWRIEISSLTIRGVKGTPSINAGRGQGKMGKVAPMIRVAALIIVATPVSCNDAQQQGDGPTPSPFAEMPLAESPLSESPSPATVPAIPLPPLPDHNYDERKGSTYYYIAAVSEEDRKRGIAVGNVHGYQYLGRNVSGEHILAGVNSDGAVNFRAKCAYPCKIIDTNDGEKIAYSTSSIIGGAFEDAFRGKLRVVDWATAGSAKPATRQVTSAAIAPVAAVPTPEAIGTGSPSLDVPENEAVPAPK